MIRENRKTRIELYKISKPEVTRLSILFYDKSSEAQATSEMRNLHVLENR